jgi:hypothetical protein
MQRGYRPPPSIHPLPAAADPAIRPGRAGAAALDAGHGRHPDLRQLASRRVCSGQTLNTSSYNLHFLADLTTAAGGGVSGVGAILDGRVGSSCDIAACPQGATGNYLAILNDGGVNFSRADHQAFSLAGFDYSFIAPITGLPDMNWGQLQLSGTLSNGQVISTSLAFPGQGSDGNYHFRSASLLSGFSNYVFTGLTFSACIFNDTARAAIPLDFPAFNQGQFALDNINISAVPEPSTYMLMLAGLAPSARCRAAAPARPPSTPPCKEREMKLRPVSLAILLLAAGLAPRPRRRSAVPTSCNWSTSRPPPTPARSPAWPPPCRPRAAPQCRRRRRAGLPELPRHQAGRRGSTVAAPKSRTSTRRVQRLCRPADRR